MATLLLLNSPSASFLPGPYHISLYLSGSYQIIQIPNIEKQGVLSCGVITLTESLQGMATQDFQICVGIPDLHRNHILLHCNSFPEHWFPPCSSFQGTCLAAPSLMAFWHAACRVGKLGCPHTDQQERVYGIKEIWKTWGVKDVALFKLEKTKELGITTFYM